MELEMGHKDCFMCQLNDEHKQYITETDNFWIIEDGFPVNEGHVLIISKRHYVDFFHMMDYCPELADEFIYATKVAKEYIETKYKAKNFNVGINCGEDAGQTVMHFHCHIIPRYKGDVENPRGGVRGVIPNKQNYQNEQEIN